jgi:hypothetical protein
MSRLLIGNEFNEDRAGLADAKRKKTGWWAQRLLWFARDDDVLVLPVAPDENYLEYVTGLTGTDRSSLRLVVPPPGVLGVGVLSVDRLADASLRATLVAALDGRPIETVVALHPDRAVADLASALGAEKAMPGIGFLAQGGGRLVNSKVIYRAVAGGTGVPVPIGGVCDSRAGAEETIGGLLDAGHPVILKHEFRAGGRGNEILSPSEDLPPVGAQRTVVVPDQQGLREYLTQRWDWLTSQGQHPFVAERYFPGSSAVFAEYDVTDQGVRFAGQGEMVSAPLAAAEIIPAPGLDADLTDALLDGGHRLCEPLFAMGYRGMLSADAIITPDREILFTEYNGRITGSTHIYRVIGEHLVGMDYATTRVLLEREGWPVPSLRAAAGRLAETGLAFSPSTRTGVVLVMPYNPSNSSIRYCLVAHDLQSAREQQEIVEALFEDGSGTPPGGHTDGTNRP